MWYLEDLKTIQRMEKHNTEILEYQNWGVGMPLEYQNNYNCEAGEHLT